MKKAKVSVTIRIAEPGDARAIAEMSRDHIESGLGWRYDPAHILRAMRRRETVVLAVSGRPTYVAGTRPALAGFAIMDFGDERAHLVLLAVRPSHRRIGIGIGRHHVGYCSGHDQADHGPGRHAGAHSENSRPRHDDNNPRGDPGLLMARSYFL